MPLMKKYTEARFVYARMEVARIGPSALPANRVAFRKPRVLPLDPLAKMEMTSENVAATNPV